MATLRPCGEPMQEGDDVEAARMRKDVQACLLNWGHDLQHKGEGTQASVYPQALGVSPMMSTSCAQVNRRSYQQRPQDACQRLLHLSSLPTRMTILMYSSCSACADMGKRSSSSCTGTPPSKNRVVCADLAEAGMRLAHGIVLARHAGGQLALS